MNNVEKAKLKVNEYCELRKYDMDIVRKLKVSFNSDEVFFALDRVNSSNGQGLYNDMENLPYLIFTYNIRSETILETENTFRVFKKSQEETDIPYEDGDNEDRKIKELCKLGPEELESLSDKLEKAELERLNTLTKEKE